MAKVNLEYDTNDKTLSTKMDGKDVTDVHEMNLYKVQHDKDGKHKYAAQLTMRKRDGEHDTTHVHHVMASEQDSGLTINFIDTTSPIHAAVAKYFGE